MKQVTIKIDTENAAFEDDPAELSRILRKLAEQLEEGSRPETLRDANGNTCGVVQYE